MANNGSDKKFGFGIVGCGMIANWHAHGIEAAERGTLMGAFDIKSEYAENFCARYGIKQYATFEEILADDKIEVLSICTPSGLHAKYALDAARAGKHILIEKPIALNVADADGIIEASEKYNIKIGVVSQLRFRKATKILKSIIVEGRLGRIVTADLFMKYNRTQDYYDQSKWRGTWALDGGGALMNQGIHGVDILLYIMGPVKSVFGMARTLARNIEVEDTASAVLEFANGTIGIIQGTTSVYPGYPRHIAISGTKGTVGLTEDQFTEWNIEREQIPDDIQLNASITTTANDPSNIDFEGHNAQINDIIDSIINDRRPTVDCREGRRAVELITAIYESSRSGKAVNLQVHM
jgi:predicted dehydrogenase